MKALLVGDSRDLVENISFCLRLRWPDVTVVRVAGGAEAVEAVETHAPHVLIADCSLPDMSCLDMVEKVRAFSDVPLVVLVRAGTGEMDRAKLLEAGADDYLVSPPSSVDVLAKLRAILRRTSGEGLGQNDAPKAWGDLTINFATHEVSVAGKAVRLTLQEYNLLVSLARNQGRVLTHNAMLERVWGPEYTSSEGIIKKYVCRIREKLQDNPEHPRFIITERGVGYRFAGINA